MTGSHDQAEIDRAELARIAAELRHAYSHLVNGRVTDFRSFADGLLAPQIRRLELMTENHADANVDADAQPDEGAAPAPR